MSLLCDCKQSLLTPSLVIYNHRIENRPDVSLPVHLSLTFSCPRFSPCGSRISHAGSDVCDTCCEHHVSVCQRQFLKSTVFLEILKTCSKCTLHILQLLCKYFSLLFFTLCLPVAMTHYLDLWHLKTVKTAIFIT